MPLVSIRAYARMRGLKSDNSVRKAIAAGKISLVNGQIDPELADADWARNRDASQDSKLAKAVEAVSVAPAVTPHQEGLPLCAPATSEPATRAESATPAPLTAARIRSTEESASIKEIQRRKLQETILESEEVERTWGEILQKLKDRMLGVPDSIAAELLGCKEEAQVRAVLLRAMRECLTVMSSDIERMVAA